MFQAHVFVTDFTEESRSSAFPFRTEFASAPGSRLGRVSPWTKHFQKLQRIYSYKNIVSKKKLVKYNYLLKYN